MLKYSETKLLGICNCSNKVLMQANVAKGLDLLELTAWICECSLESLPTFLL